MYFLVLFKLAFCNFSIKKCFGDAYFTSVGKENSGGICANNVTDVDYILHIVATPPGGSGWIIGVGWVRLVINPLLREVATRGANRP